jgi:hypothetical protein
MYSENIQPGHVFTHNYRGHESEYSIGNSVPFRTCDTPENCVRVWAVNTKTGLGGRLFTLNADGTEYKGE